MGTASKGSSLTPGGPSNDDIVDSLKRLNQYDNLKTEEKVAKAGEITSAVACTAIPFSPNGPAKYPLVKGINLWFQFLNNVYEGQSIEEASYNTAKTGARSIITSSIANEVSGNLWDAVEQDIVDQNIPREYDDMVETTLSQTLSIVMFKGGQTFD